MTAEDLYPEAEKLGNAIVERNAIVEFLEWASNEKGARLCNVPGSHEWHPITDQTQALAHEFLDINEQKLEAERRAMLAAARGEA